MKRVFRGPWDYLALGFVVLVLLAMLSALSYVKGVTDERIAHEIKEAARETRSGALRGYVVVRYAKPTSGAR